MSGNASSNEEGLDTCVSSDIEVLSLPSTNGGEHFKITKSLTSTYAKITTNQVDELEEEEAARQRRIDDEKNNRKDTTIQAHANNMHSQLIANSNVMQIFHNTNQESLTANQAWVIKLIDYFKLVLRDIHSISKFLDESTSECKLLTFLNQLLIAAISNRFTRKPRFLNLV